jgi:uncharacterized membrane protein YkvA (DUF1232 family)
MDKPLDGELFGPGEEAGRTEVKSVFWHTVRKAARSIPFMEVMEEVVAAYFCAMDRQTPARVRLTLLGALGYFILPTDSIPDFIVLFGFSDDIAILTGVIATVRGHITPAHRKAAKDALADMAGA